jgi:hypothetical protein
MDEKTQKEVDAVLAEEREKMVKEMSLVSWFRTWLWLMFAERKRSSTLSRAPARRVRPSRWRQLTAFLSSPLRAWRVYRYAKLEKKARETAEDAWLTKTLDILQGGPVIRRRAALISKAVVGPAAFKLCDANTSRGRIPAGSTEVDGDDPFVKFITGEA